MGEDLEKLKQKFPLLDYLRQQNWAARPAGHGPEFVGLCPLHPETRPSFYVNARKNLFYCHGCGQGGDLIRFVELSQHLSFRQSLTYLEQHSAPRDPTSVLGQASAFYQRQLDRYPEARRYLERRGVRDPALIRELQIGYAPGGSLRRHLLAQGYSLDLLRRAGLVSSQGHDTLYRRVVFPCCQDRLIPIWVATLALRQKSRTVHFASAAQMLEFFRFPKDGRYYRRMVQGFQRLFASTIFFGTEEQPAGSHLFDWARFHFFDHIRLWFTEQDKCSPPLPDDVSNTITLSEAFYNEIDQHRVPMEREVVIALANSPGVLDFYVWIAWKSWVLKSERTGVPLFSPGGLKEQLGCQIHAENRFLRRKVNQWLRVIRAHWPQCPAQISADGQSLIISSSKSSPALHPVPMNLRSSCAHS